MRELSLNVMDVAQNSISAGAKLITIEVAEDTASGHLVIAIEDNGCGMTAEQLEKVQNPFYTTRTTRDVGLGIPLFKMAGEMTGGSFSIRSQPGQGTRVQTEFCTGHIDMTPLGDINETVSLLITCNPQLDFIYRRRRDAVEYTLDTKEMREILGEDMSLDDPEVILWIKEFLKEQESELHA